MFTAQPEEELFQQLLVAAHGNSGAQQRIHWLAFHIHRADAMDAPAPVEDARAVLDQIHRGCDVGGDAGIRIALDDHLEARPGAVQRTEKALVAGIAGVGGENAGDAAAVIVRPVGVAGVEAGALLLWIAGSEVLGKMRCIEVHRTLDDADTHRLFFAGALAGGNAFAVVVHRIEEAVGGPLPVLRTLLIRALAGFLLVVLGGRFLDNHGIHTHLTAQAQHHGVALGEVLHRQAQLVGVQRRDGADHLGAVLLGKLARLVQALVILLDDQTDQIDIGGQVIHVARHFVGRGGEHLAAAGREPDRVAALAIVFQPQRSAAYCIRRERQAQLVAVALECVGIQPLAIQIELHLATWKAFGAQAPVLRVFGEEIAAALELGDADRVLRGGGKCIERVEQAEAEGKTSELTGCH